jgi:hypothetical protein
MGGLITISANKHSKPTSTRKAFELAHECLYLSYQKTHHRSSKSSVTSHLSQRLGAQYPCSLELLTSHGTVFFSHNKTISIGLSAVKTISRTAKGCFPHWTLVEVLRDAATNLTFYEPVYDCACCVFYAN